MYFTLSFNLTKLSIFFNKTNKRYFADPSVPAVMVIFHPVAPHVQNHMFTNERFKDLPFRAVIDAIFWDGEIYDCKTNREMFVKLTDVLAK